MAATRFGSLPGMAGNMAGVQQQMMSQRPQQFNQGHFQARPTGATSSPQASRMAGHPYASVAGTPQGKRPDPKSSRRVKKKKAGDKVLPQRVRELVPESQAYMDLLAFERKLDSTIMRKRLDIQEALKRPVKQKRKLRVFLTTHFHGARPDAEDEDSIVPSWELRVEGKLMDDQGIKPDVTKQKRKFSSFFRSLVIELDKDLYGPDNHLVE
ncbi:SWI SNF-related matrix-associated actin-dependent regulator of chromatin subfamily D member 1-, partial [Paramuricea clavata]